MSKGVPATPAEGALHAGWLTDFTARAPSLDARMAAGKALRDKVPHAAHAQYRPAATRRIPSRCSRRRRRRACRRWSRSATRGCSRARSRSCAGRRP